MSFPNIYATLVLIVLKDTCKGMRTCIFLMFMIKVAQCLFSYTTWSEVAHVNSTRIGLQDF